MQKSLKNIFLKYARDAKNYLLLKSLYADTARQDIETILMQGRPLDGHDRSIIQQRLKAGHLEQANFSLKLLLCGLLMPALTPLLGMPVFTFIAGGVVLTGAGYMLAHGIKLAVENENIILRMEKNRMKTLNKRLVGVLSLEQKSEY